MTAVRFPDGQRAGRDLLRTLLTGRPEPEAAGLVPANVSTRVPSGAAVPKPYVMVRVDDAGRDSRLNGYAVLRVTVWHRDEGLALSLASLCEALLLDARGAEVRAVSPVTSPIPTTDPDSGDPLAFFRVTARLRPQNL